MKYPYILFILFLQAMLVSTLHAQLTGTKTIPGDYATIADAITAVNASGVTTPGVMFNIAPGHTETGVNYTINTSTSSSTSPIIFQKFGFGDNPKITVSAGTAAATDAGVKIAGSDYVTFDGIDINASAQTTIEWGYALVKKNGLAPFDGCQYVTIKNCTITLNKTNTNSVGIYVANHTATSTAGLSITSSADAHNNCRFYTDTIQNCSSGITITGYSTYTLHDQNNDIGGTSTSTGNIIQNFGNTASAAYGIKVVNQTNFNIAYNTIDNTAGGGSIHQNSLYGIHFGTGTAASFSILNNNLTLNKGSGNELTGIYTNFNSSTGLFNIYYNFFDGCRNETSNSSETDFIYINGYGYNATLNVRNNTIKNSFSKKDIYVIKNKAFFTTVNIANNYVYNIETESGFHGIYSDYFSVPGNEYRCTDIISGNTLFNIRAKTDLYGIESRNSAMYKEITSNILDSLCALPSVAPPIVTSNSCTGIYFIPHSSSYNPDSVWFNSNIIRRLFSQNYTTGIKLDIASGHGCNAGPYRFSGNEICWLISSYNYKDSAAYTVGCDFEVPCSAVFRKHKYIFL